MPVPVSSRNNKSPSQKAEDVEKELEKAEAEAKVKAKEEMSKQEGDGQATTPGSESAPDKETSPKKEPAEETPKAGQPEEQPEEDLDEEEVQQLSAKAQKRYRKMAAEIKDLKSKLPPAKPEGEDATPQVEVPIEEPKVEGEDFSDLKEPITPATPEKPKKKLPWEAEESDENGEATLTEEELEAKARKISQEESQKTLRADKEKKYNFAIVNRVVADVRELEKSYDILNPKYDLKGSNDPKSPNYNANYGKSTNPNYRDDIARSIVSTYKKLFQADKRVRLLTFAKQQLGLIEQGRALGKKEVESVVNKQDAEQPLTPSGGSPRKSGAIEAIKKASTLEELEAAEALL